MEIEWKAEYDVMNDTNWLQGSVVYGDGKLAIGRKVIEGEEPTEAEKAMLQSDMEDYVARMLAEANEGSE